MDQEIIEREPKRIRIEHSTPTSNDSTSQKSPQLVQLNSSSPHSDSLTPNSNCNDVMEKLQQGSDMIIDSTTSPPQACITTSSRTPQTSAEEKGSSPIEQDSDNLKSIAYLKKENEKKDNIIKDLVKKLHDSMDTIKMQSDQIKELQVRLQVQAAPTSTTSPTSPLRLSGEHQIAVPNHTSPPVAQPEPSPRPLAILAEESAQMLNSLVEMKIIQQPPSQAIYQRILRPFPQVSVFGVHNLKTANTLFVEVSLLKDERTSSGSTGKLQAVTSNKNESALDGDKKNMLIGGQLVARSEITKLTDPLIVTFRKLKILTTTMQQGGSYFLLKFVLKQYIDNVFQTVAGVKAVLSDPIEVFSHTLYLKNRSPRSSSEGIKFNLKSESADGIKFNVKSESTEGFKFNFQSSDSTSLANSNNNYNGNNNNNNNSTNSLIQMATTILNSSTAVNPPNSPSNDSPSKQLASETNPLTTLANTTVMTNPLPVAPTMDSTSAVNHNQPQSLVSSTATIVN